MTYTEIQLFDIKNNPERVSAIVEDNANHFANDLYILTEGNHHVFSDEAKSALLALAGRINRYFERTNYYNAEFEWEDRRFKVVNWDDTDEMWIARDRWGNLRYFTPEKLDEIFPKKGLTNPH